MRSLLLGIRPGTRTDIESDETDAESESVR